MANERNWLAIPAKPFLSNGGQYGQISILSTVGVKVKQKVKLYSNTLPIKKEFEVKSVINETDIEVGPASPGMEDRSDVSMYLVADGAMLIADRQARPSIAPDIYNRSVFEEEPTVAVRTFAVDHLGRQYTTQNPFPVRLSDGSINIGTVNADIETQLSHKDNFPTPGDVADSVRIGDGVEELAINTDNEALVHDLDTHTKIEELKTITQTEFDQTQVKQEAGNVSLASIDNKLTKIRAKNYLNSDPVEILADEFGRLFVTPTPLGTPHKLRTSRNIAAGQANYNDFTVPVGQKYEIDGFYVGGTGSGSAGLFRHFPNNFTYILNGDIESTANVTAWGVLQGTFTAPTPDFSTNQAFNGGIGSMRWTFSDSASNAKAVKRRQTFSTVQDFSTHRYLRLRFFNDGAVGITRTLSVVINSGASNRTFTFPFTSGVTLPSNTWTTLTCDLENPTSVTGTGFDITSINSMDISLQDSAARVSTVYWDSFRLEDEFDRLHRIYFGNLITVPLSIKETILSGESVYLLVINSGGATMAVTSVVSGVLV